MSGEMKGVVSDAEILARYRLRIVHEYKWLLALEEEARWLVPRLTPQPGLLLF